MPNDTNFSSASAGDFPTSLSRPGNHIVPMVIETEGRQERAYDIYSRLLKDRIVFIGTPIDDTVAKLARFVEREDLGINLYVRVVIDAQLL